MNIPYKDEKCSFVVVLPKNTTKINNLKIKLKRNNDAVNKALNVLKERYIELSMPVFQFETQTDLKIVLQNVSFSLKFVNVEKRQVQQIVLVLRFYPIAITPNVRVISECVSEPESYQNVLL